MGKKIYALTGVTGLFGRNVFFEIIKDHLQNLDEITFILLGRSTKNSSLKNRIKQLFFTEGLHYLGSTSIEKDVFEQFFESQITYVSINLSENIIITEKERQKMIGKHIDYFFHVAAVTDFRNEPKVIQTLDQQNVTGTAKVLELCKGLSIKEFCHISSAYACGKTYGDIAPDYTNTKVGFRNHYEKTKLQGELLVNAYQNETGVRCRIFRPSIIVGKLMEDLKGEICKFDTIYGWAFFFLKWKLKNVCSSISSVYSKQVQLPIRIAINTFSGLNLVPVDFAAKMLYKICKLNLNGTYFHLVNNEETNNALVLKKIFELFSISGYELVKEVPKNLNALENFYYKTIGNIFTPYVTQESMNFNTDNLLDIPANEQIYCPVVEENALEILLNYAKSKNFGIDEKYLSELKFQV